MFNKFGESISFNTTTNILSSKEALVDEEITKRFIKLAKKLKRVAPKSSNFLYFSSIIIHSAEAALINQETGEPIKNAKGDPVRGWFEKIKVNGKDSLKWISPDNIKPFFNANRDCFPDEEIRKAHAGWRNCPLCKDHVSDSVEGLRGLVIDTYYDPKFKRVHALAALDRVSYADLARKVEMGYANCVSMGTGVSVSHCGSCGNSATTEKEYCKCVRSHSAEYEINVGLNPLELSLVVNGADPLAKVKHIIASMNDYVAKKQANVDELLANRCVCPTELQSLADSISDIQKQLKALIGLPNPAAQTDSMTKNAGEVFGSTLGELVAAVKVLQAEKAATTDQAKRDSIQAKIDALVIKLPGEVDAEVGEIQSAPKSWPPKDAPQAVAATGGGSEPSFATPGDTMTDAVGVGINPTQRFASIRCNEGDNQGVELSLLRSKIDALSKSYAELTKVVHKENIMNAEKLAEEIKARALKRRAYWQGGGGVNEPTPGKPKYPKEEADKIRNTEDKQMVGVKDNAGTEGLYPGDKEVKKELCRAELEARKLQRRGYFQGAGGVSEPTPGEVKYPKEEADKIRNTEDKQMQTKDLGGTDGMVPGDKEVKEILLRAQLRARFTKVADDKGAIVKDASRWDVFAGDKLILSATGKDIYGDELGSHWDYLSSKEYGMDVIASIRNDGFAKTAYLLKGAADPVMPSVATPDATPAIPEPPMPKDEPVEKPKTEMQEKVEKALSDIEAKISEVRDALSGGGSDELVDIDVNVGKDKGKEEELPELPPMDKALGATKMEALKVVALMDESADELALVSETLKVNAKDEVIKAAAEALADCNALIAEAGLIIEAKKVDKAKAKKLEDKAEKKEDKAAELMDKAKKLMDEAKEMEAKAKELMGEKEIDVEARAEKRAELLAQAAKVCKDCDTVEAVEDPKAHLSARKAAREALVVEAAKDGMPEIHVKPLTLDKQETVTEPTFFAAHPKGGTVTELTGTKTPEAKVETIAEQHEAILEVAEKKVSVREAAAILNEQIVNGSVKAVDVERLVAEGKADKDAVDYWKKYFAQAPDSGTFGADLSKDFATKKASADVDVLKTKMRRAYSIAIEAQDKGGIGGTKLDLDKYVDDLMMLDDPAFESVKRIVAKMKNPAKTGSMPHVGLVGEQIKVKASAEPETELSLLNTLNWK